jgi:23S rRNA pseudouridine1911/1915/1917 synthase
MNEEVDIEEVNDNEEFFHHFIISVDKGQEPLRIDKFLTNRIERISRTKFRYACDAGCITANGVEVRANYKVQPGDQLEVYVPRPFNAEQLKPENIPLDIMYEDDEMIVLNKPKGLVVHPGVGNFTGTLVNALLYHYHHLPFAAGQELKPGLVHRLDKDTTGVMVTAKNDFSLAHLSKQFADRTMYRRYVTLVWGNVEKEEGTIEGNIGRHPRERKWMTVYPDGEAGKTAVTHYKVLERFGYVTLVECKLETGRTHQIRVHMKYLGHTVFNDERYGGDKILKGTIFSKYKQFVENCFQLCPRQALHAKSLGIVHPKTGENMFFEKELPQDMALVIEKWREYIKGRGVEENE